MPCPRRSEQSQSRPRIRKNPGHPSRKDHHRVSISLRDVWSASSGSEKHPVLARYQIYRGPSPPPLPKGIRQDTRWRTRHPLRPMKEMVEAYLASPHDAAWRTFRKAYLALLAERLRTDRTPFDELSALARHSDVFIGCSCPTKANPRVDRCHTFPALEFMRRKYRGLRVELPQSD